MHLLRLQRHFFPVGLDIKDSAVYGVQFCVVDGHTRLHATGKMRMGLRADAAGTLEAIRSLLLSTPFVGHQVVTALPREEVDIRPLILPPGCVPENEEAFQEAFLQQAALCLPYPPADAVLDYLPLDLDDSEGHERFRVLLIAARKEHVERHLALCRQAGLQCVHLDVAPCAAARVFHRSEETAALVELDRLTTTISIIQGEKLLFSRTIRMGMQDLIGEVGATLHITEAEAKRLLNVHGFDNVRRSELNLRSVAGSGRIDSKVLPTVLYEVCSTILGRIAAELQRSIGYFLHVNPRQSLERLVLMGDAIPLDTESCLSELLSRQVVLGDWHARPRFTDEAAGVESSAYAVAAGLAIRGEAA